VRTVCMLVVMLVSAWPAAQRETGRSADQQYVGAWSGRWEGSGSGGGFELTIESKENVLSGRVSVTGQPTYKATLRATPWAAAYDFTPDEQAEVILSATFDGDTAKGSNESAQASGRPIRCPVRHDDSLFIAAL
jgi:hypothetical protein